MTQPSPLSQMLQANTPQTQQQPGMMGALGNNLGTSYQWLQNAIARLMGNQALQQAASQGSPQSNITPAQDPSQLQQAVNRYMAEQAAAKDQISNTPTAILAAPQKKKGKK